MNNRDEDRPSRRCSGWMTNDGRETIIQRKKMTKEEHKARHQVLHEHLDELVGDWIGHEMQHGNGKMLSNTSIMELMKWSYEQTQDPKELA